MEGLVPFIENSIMGQMDTLLPDPGVMAYVKHLLRQILDLDTDTVPEKFYAVAITSTLDWVKVEAAWLIDALGVLEHRDQYEYVYVWQTEFSEAEIDPRRLIMFLENPRKNKFPYWVENPGVFCPEDSNGIQRELPLISWIKEEGFAGHRLNVPGEEFTPLLEAIAWATLTWVLSDYGRAWVGHADANAGYCLEHGVTFLAPDSTQGRKKKKAWAILDHRFVKRKQRRQGSCANCGVMALPCMEKVRITPDTSISDYLTLCNACMVASANAGTFGMPNHERVNSPECHKLGGQCKNTLCPHSGWTYENTKEAMQAAGSERVEEYKEWMRDVGGVNHRELAGQTAEIITNYYTKRS